MDWVYGPDLMLLLCEEAARRGWRSFSYGGKEGVAKRWQTISVGAFPASGGGDVHAAIRPLTPAEDDDIVQRINDSSADLVWVARPSKNVGWPHTRCNSKPSPYWESVRRSTLTPAICRRRHDGCSGQASNGRTA